MGQFRELYLMMEGFVNAVRAIMFGTTMVLVMLTMISIMAVEILQPLVEQLDDAGKFEGCDRCVRSFDTISASVLTFMQTIVAGDSWGTLAVPLMEESWQACGVLGIAFVIIELGLINVIAAVIVDRQQQARSDDEKLAVLLQSEGLLESYKKLAQVFDEMDNDNR